MSCFYRHIIRPALFTQQTEEFHRQCFRTQEGLHHVTNQFVSARETERAHGAVVNFLGLLREERGPDDVAVEATHERLVAAEVTRLNLVSTFRLFRASLRRLLRF